MNMCGIKADIGNSYHTIVNIHADVYIDARQETFLTLNLLDPVCPFRVSNAFFILLLPRLSIRVRT